MKTYKIDLVDKKLLRALGQDARQSQQQLAKKLRISRDQVQYRLQKLEESKVITGYISHTQNKLFGVENYRVLLRLQHVDRAKEKRILRKLKSLHHAKYLSRMRGAADVQLLLGAKNKVHIAQLIERIEAICGEHLAHKELLIPYKTVVADEYKFLVEDETYVAPKRNTYTGEGIDNTDKRIIKHLTKNARIPIIEIAADIDMSAQQTSTRIKKLHRTNAITSTQAVVDTQQLGYENYHVLLKLAGARRAERKLLVELLHNNPYITFAEYALGTWDVSLTITSPDQKTFLETFDALRAHLGKQLADSTFSVEQERLLRRVVV